MNPFKILSTKNPAAKANLIVALCEAILGGLVYFKVGWFGTLSPEGVGVVMGIIIALANVIVAFIADNQTISKTI